MNIIKSRVNQMFITFILTVNPSFAAATDPLTVLTVVASIASTFAPKAAPSDVVISENHRILVNMHRRMSEIDESLISIMRKLDQMPERTRVLLEASIDKKTAETLLAASEMVHLAWKDYSILYNYLISTETDSEENRHAAIEKLHDQLREALALLTDRRFQLALRDGSDVRPLIASSIVETMALRLLGEPTPIIYSRLDWYKKKMEENLDPDNENSLSYLTRNIRALYFDAVLKKERLFRPFLDNAAELNKNTKDHLWYCALRGGGKSYIAPERIAQDPDDYSEAYLKRNIYFIDEVRFTIERRQLENYQGPLDPEKVKNISWLELASYTNSIPVGPSITKKDMLERWQKCIWTSDKAGGKYEKVNGKKDVEAKDRQMSEFVKAIYAEKDYLLLLVGLSGRLYTVTEYHKALERLIAGTDPLPDRLWCSSGMNNTECLSVHSVMNDYETFKGRIDYASLEQRVNNLVGKQWVADTEQRIAAMSDVEQKAIEDILQGNQRIENELEKAKEAKKWNDVINALRLIKNVSVLYEMMAKMYESGTVQKPFVGPPIPETGKKFQPNMMSRSEKMHEMWKIVARLDKKGPEALSVQNQSEDRLESWERDIYRFYDLMQSLSEGVPIESFPDAHGTGSDLEKYDIDFDWKKGQNKPRLMKMMHGFLLGAEILLSPEKVEQGTLDDPSNLRELYRRMRPYRDKMGQERGIKLDW